MSDTLFDLDTGLPHQRASATSRAAAERLNPATMRAEVLGCLRSRGPMTDEAIQETLSMNPSTQRPRRVELVRAGLVADSGREGRTRSGRRAVLWAAVTA